MNIKEILKTIKTTLGISDNILDDIITRKNLTSAQLATKYDNKITDLIKKNTTGFNDFENKIQGSETKENFKKFKRNLGQLQILILIKKLEKSTNCDEIIKSFLDVLNPNIEALISIQEDQSGGGEEDDYYNKYLKYKKKYFILKKILLDTDNIIPYKLLDLHP